MPAPTKVCFRLVSLVNVETERNSLTEQSDVSEWTVPSYSCLQVEFAWPVCRFVVCHASFAVLMCRLSRRQIGARLLWRMARAPTKRCLCVGLPRLLPADSKKHAKTRNKETRTRSRIQVRLEGWCLLMQNCNYSLDDREAYVYMEILVQQLQMLLPWLLYPIMQFNRCILQSMVF